MIGGCDFRFCPSSCNKPPRLRGLALDCDRPAGAGAGHSGVARAWRCRPNRGCGQTAASLSWVTNTFFLFLIYRNLRQNRRLNLLGFLFLFHPDRLPRRHQMVLTPKASGTDRSTSRSPRRPSNKGEEASPQLTLTPTNQLMT